MRNTSVVILTDDAEFARLLTACWQNERQLPAISLLTSELWRSTPHTGTDLLVVGPLKEIRLPDVLRALAPHTAVILCAPAEIQEFGKLRLRFPRLLHVLLREDWTQVVLLLAGESLRRTEAIKLAQQAERTAAQYTNEAVLGRYMTDMKHNLNNALTSLLGNAELLLLEPGELSAQSLAQIKTIHTMALRINEVMVRFSSLASEMRGAETASQPETEDATTPLSRRR